MIKTIKPEYLAPDMEVLEMQCSESIMTQSFILKELNLDESDNDFFNF